jgi:hypothetical protein
MSTTASIFKKPKVPYTVIGGPKIDRIRKIQPPLSLLLLNRGSRFYRQEKLRELGNAGLGEILCVEGPRISYDIEPLSREFTRIRFLLLQEEASPGEKINLGIEEARTRLVFVMWSDMEVIDTPAPEGRIEKGRAEAAKKAKDGLSSSFLQEMEDKEILCTVPRLGSSEGQVIPSLQFPVLIKGKLNLIPRKPAQEGMKSLFPFDYCGIYNRRRFLLSGGFDSWMTNPYWQKLDFGLCRRDLSLRYEAESRSEDTSADVSYKLFYLKNMAVRFNGEMGVLPSSKRFAYCLRSDSRWLEARNEFREVQRWVQQNRYRFKSDVQSLVSHWEVPE